MVLEQAEIAGLKRENSAIRAEAQAYMQDCARQLAEMRASTAKVVYALDCSVQLIEALIAWMPEGLVLSDQVKSAKGAWSKAMQDIRR